MPFETWYLTKVSQWRLVCVNSVVRSRPPCQGLQKPWGDREDMNHPLLHRSFSCKSSSWQDVAGCDSSACFPEHPVISPAPPHFSRALPWHWKLCFVSHGLQALLAVVPPSPALTCPPLGPPALTALPRTHSLPSK